MSLAKTLIQKEIDRYKRGLIHNEHFSTQLTKNKPEGYKGFIKTYQADSDNFSKIIKELETAIKKL